MPVWEHLALITIRQSVMLSATTTVPSPEEISWEEADAPKGRALVAQVARAHNLVSQMI